ncbi:uncharacterized protein MONBRDRAFT_31431 [Monosiga brevicollis MX1]|uniref:Rhodanese domain-containing protein n=1 Tax=Monosiga brevicollis TaxID=81824 RepID=A9UT40_MONBE|nr:uncharacterized protein MONBRDRAFT_31431 [Monosiga brevicollis MX1]EDQ91429.1 predicted protein [Monosiga brevicollis MX1]|eukprot:XP_001743851.1 hypothetical protein [Monosiga brevicollis MX1]
MLELTRESFDLLVKTDPVPHVLVDARCRSDSNDLTVPASTVVVKPAAFQTSMLPEDGCVCIVYDAEPALVDTGALACVQFNINTAAREHVPELEEISCDTVTEQGEQNYVLDVRRTDEVDNFGKLPHADSIPLHLVLQQLSADDKSPALTNMLRNDRTIIVGCRTNRRARFMTQILLDMGMKSVKFIDKGACGCSQIPSNDMKCYPSYEVSDPVPAPNN